MFNLETHQILELPGSRQLHAPRWSPDGRYIIAISSDNSKLMLCDVENHKWRQLGGSLQPGDYGYMSWSRDSAYVYFDAVSVSGKDSGYFRVRISDSKLEKVYDLKGFRPFPTVFGGGGSWTGLGPGDTPLIPRDISTQEIYALDLQLP